MKHLNIIIKKSFNIFPAMSVILMLSVFVFVGQIFGLSTDQAIPATFQ